MRKVTYCAAKKNFDSLLNEVADQRKTVLIRKRGSKDVAMIRADELAGLETTIHLLRSPANTKRLFTALERTKG